MNYMNLQSKEEVKMKSVERLCLDGTLLGKSLLGGDFAWRRLFLEDLCLEGTETDGSSFPLTEPPP